MPEARDIAIKLFGRTIAVEKDKDHPNKEETTRVASKNTEEESPNSEDKKDPDEEQNDSSNSQENKRLKKPDKIVPCPRCNSLETKFCYYNNYNVNQPRHFCKNCQRYWTDGGTMRNVPVGAGRRKNKNSIATQYRHHLTNKSDGTVLSFGSDTPLRDSVASVLNLADKNHRNGFQSTDEQMEDQSSGSSVTGSTSNDEGLSAKLKEPVIPYMTGSTFPMPFYPPQSYWGCAPWSLPWLESIPDSATLGKHPREVEITGEERCRVWLPKTLRIAGPEEAAKSSIWASMGFESDEADGLFKPFQRKGEIRAHLSKALHANPAALSRSFNFQENS